jgi:Fe-S-cluster containining protein
MLAVDICSDFSVNAAKNEATRVFEPKMNEVLALIFVNSKFVRVTGFSIEQKRFKLKCKRCADLCCKLGVPPLTILDVERIEERGYSVKDFLEPESNGMKSRENGSCIFLEFDSKQNRYKCNIYDFRPLLCRLYQFSLEFTDSSQLALKFIPCCRGLNNNEGETLNNFVSNYLFELLLEALKTAQKRVKAILVFHVLPQNSHCRFFCPFCRLRI